MGLEALLKKRCFSRRVAREKRRQNNNPTLLSMGPCSLFPVPSNIKLQNQIAAFRIWLKHFFTSKFFNKCYREYPQASSEIGRLH